MLLKLYPVLQELHRLLALRLHVLQFGIAVEQTIQLFAYVLIMYPETHKLQIEGLVLLYQKQLATLPYTTY